MAGRLSVAWIPEDRKQPTFRTSASNRLAASRIERFLGPTSHRIGPEQFYYLRVLQDSVGQIIGRGGSRINEIRTIYGVSVHILQKREPTCYYSLVVIGYRTTKSLEGVLDELSAY